MKISGRAIEVITLPMPKKIIREGLRMPATYANFYIANTCVLVPTLPIPLTKPRCRSCANVFQIAASSGLIAAS
jgi:Peptidylarginine deiminase and related enzymes